MIEEIYKEEFGDSEMKSKLESALREPKDDPSASEDKIQDLQNNLMTGTADSVNAGQVSNSKCNHPFNADNIMDSGISKLRRDQRPNVDDPNFYQDDTVCTSQNGDRSVMATAAAYDIQQFDNFAVGNQVSLALKLQHCENDGFSMLGGSNVRGTDTSASLDYHCLDAGQQESRYNNQHLLHDFVV